MFYPGDYLRDTQCLSEPVQVAYDRIMCEHMRNICISQAQLNFFTKKLSAEEKQELLMVLTEIPGGFQIDWVVTSITKRIAYSESRSKNREGKTKNISKSYDSHMESEDENEIEDVIKKKKRVSKIFRETEFFDLPTFSAAFDGTKYESANMEYYHESILNWSDSKGEKKLDWIAAAKGWMIRDIKENKFIDKNFNHGNKAFTKPNGQLGTSAARFEGIKNLR